MTEPRTAAGRALTWFDAVIISHDPLVQREQMRVMRAFISEIEAEAAVLDVERLARLDAAWQWVAANYPKVLVEMPSHLIEIFRECARLSEAER